MIFMKKRIYKLIAFIIVITIAGTGLSLNSTAMNDTKENIKLKIKAKTVGPSTLISWNSIENADYYKVYRSTKLNNKKKQLSTTLKTEYTDKRAISGKKYYYHIKAFYKDGTSSKYYSTPFRTVTRVILFSGHGRFKDGSWDTGCTYKKYEEAKLVAKITNSFAKYCRRNGLYVYTDAPESSMNMDTILDFVNTHSSSAFVAVHCDYYLSPSGYMACYKTKKQKELSKYLLKGIGKYIKIKNKGYSYRTDLKTLGTKQPYTSLIETGSIKADIKVLKNYDKYGKGLAKGLCSFLKVKFKTK